MLSFVYSMRVRPYFQTQEEGWKYDAQQIGYIMWSDTVSSVRCIFSIETTSKEKTEKLNRKNLS